MEDLVKAFESAYSQKQSTRCSNAALLVAGLYNLGAIHCATVYELIRRLVCGFGELELQLLLKLLTSIGGQLRADDPKALAEIILLVQQQQPSAPPGSDGGVAQSARLRVFLQMLADLKNNRHRGKIKEDPRLSRMQKEVKLLGAKAAVPAPLKAGWDELVHAQERGRWWLVGSAWAGRASGAEAAVGQAAAAKAQDAAAAEVRAKGSKNGFAAAEDRLVGLASAQRMNTDTRKAIFVAIMGADDYVNAYERILKLRLPKAQRGEVARVIFHCCSQEVAFNPFYALLSARVCAADRECRFTFNVVFWETFKELKSLPLNRAACVAKLLAQLLSRNALPLTTLKVVAWHDLGTRGVFFWQVCLIELLSGDQSGLHEAVHPLHAPKFTTLRDGLLLFVSVHLRDVVARKHAELLPRLEALAESLTLSAA